MIKRKIIQYIVIPLVLVGSDIFIAFNAHFAGKTGNDYSWESLCEYVGTLTWDDLAPVIVVAIIVVGLVEYIMRK